MTSIATESNVNFEWKNERKKNFLGGRERKKMNANDEKCSIIFNDQCLVLSRGMLII